MKSYGLFFLIIIAFTSCDYYDDRLQIKNNSSKVICFDTQNDTFLSYPSINDKEFYLSEKILPGKTKAVALNGATDAWEQFIAHSHNRTMSLFIFDFDTVVKYNWDSIRKYGKYIKRYDLKVRDLKLNDWTVIFQ
jgi:hypothetical protein